MHSKSYKLNKFNQFFVILAHPYLVTVFESVRDT